MTHHRLWSVQQATAYAAVAGTLAVAAPAMAQSSQRGAVIARTHCMTCHSIDKVSPSPLRIAPPFRELLKVYPVEQLEEALAEGISTGHPTMPEFRFDPDQIGDLLEYLRTLK